MSKTSISNAIKWVEIKGDNQFIPPQFKHLWDLVDRYHKDIEEIDDENNKWYTVSISKKADRHAYAGDEELFFIYENDDRKLHYTPVDEFLTFMELLPENMQPKIGIYYTTLGVKEHVVQRTIVSRYNALKLRFRLSSNGEQALSQELAAERTEAFGKITEAYQILSNSESRKTYDSTIRPKSKEIVQSTAVECSRRNSSLQIFIDKSLKKAGFKMDSLETDIESKNKIEGLDSDTFLTNLDPALCGFLVGIAFSENNLPDAFVSRYRNLVARLIENKEFKKLLLIPTLLLIKGPGKFDRKSKREMLQERFKLLENEVWPFRIRHLYMRERITAEMVNAEAKKGHVKKLMAAAEVSKAAESIYGKQTAAGQNNETFTSLQEQTFPRRLGFYSEETMEQLNKYKTPIGDALQITSKEYGKAVAALSKVSAPGLNKLPASLEMKAFGYEDDTSSEVRRYRDAKVGMSNMILRGEFPEELLPFIRDMDDTALVKNDGTLRHILKQSTERKIISKAALRQIKSEITPLFEETQVCLDSNGAEKLAQTFRVSMELDQQMDTMSMDGLKAFPQVSMTIMLFKVMTIIPALFTFVKSMYTGAKVWYFGCDEGISNVTITEGVSIGDVLAMILYALTMNDFILGMRKFLTPDKGFNIYFADDGQYRSKWEDSLKTLDYILLEGPKYGYILNWSKSSYLLGRTEDYELAMSRKQILVDEYGFSEERVKIHPADMLLGNPERYTSAVEEYGLCLVGRPVGTNEFIRKWLVDKAEKLRLQADSLIEFGDYQIIYLVLRYSYSTKIEHLSRLLDLSGEFSEFRDEFATQIKRVLAVLLEGEDNPGLIADSTWKQSRFPVSQGGLGLGGGEVLSGYIASIFETSPFVEKKITEYVQLYADFSDPSLDLDPQGMIPTLRIGTEVVQKLNVGIGETREIREFQLILENATNDPNDLTKKSYQKEIKKLVNVKSRDNFLKSIDDFRKLAHFVSVSDSQGKAGLVLEVLPKDPGTVLTNSEFQTILKFRIYLPQLGCITGMRCRCGVSIDVYGHHFCTACKIGPEIHRKHDECTDVFQRAANAGGILTTREINIDNNATSERVDLCLEGRIAKLLVETGITNAVKAPHRGDVPMSRVSAMVEGAQAEKYYKAKVEKYKVAAEIFGAELRPLIFEASGRMHPNSIKLCDFIFKQIHPEIEDTRQRALISRFWYKKMSFALQRGNARAILRRCNNCHYQLRRAAESEETSPFNMLNDEIRHAGRLL